MTKKKRVPVISPVVNTATITVSTFNDIAKLVECINNVDCVAEDNAKLAKKATRMFTALDTYGHPELVDIMARIVRNANSVAMLYDMIDGTYSVLREEINIVRRTLAIEAAIRLERQKKQLENHNNPELCLQDLETEGCTL